MGKLFRSEVDYLPEAMSWALSQNIDKLRRVVWALSDVNLIAVGSGGSFSASVLVAQQHEQVFGLVSRAATPLEVASQGTQLHRAAVGLISAEGKNTDILAAAESLRHRGPKAFALSLTTRNPLAEYCLRTGVAAFVGFDMPWGKDGYLATNSLVATAVLASRAYSVNPAALEAKLAEFNGARLAEQRETLNSNPNLFVARGQALLILHGSRTRVAALDIESKLSEAALAVCQVVDFRQFAHGRHLQLATENPPALVLVLHSQHDAPLAQRTINLVPSGIKRAVFAFPDDLAEASIEGFIFATLLTELVAEGQGVDPGRPEVPKFCRELHSIDVRAALPPIQKSPIPAVDRKLSAARTDLSKHREWTTEAIRFCEALCAARFKAIVCDFDGTFCETDRRFEGLDERLIPSIVRLLRAKITIGFATGRGDSLYGDLSRKLPPDVHQGIFIGYYTGSTVVNLNERPEFGPNDVNLDRLSNWIHSVGIAHRLRASPAVKVSQLGIRVEDQRFKASAIEAIRSQLQESVGASCRVFSSGHSIDVISGPAGKERVVEKISQAIGCDPLTDMLRIGDSGDHDGNDFELLNVGFGLSVGSVSCLPDRCWNFLPSELSGVPGTRHYFDSLDVNDGYVRFCDRFLSETISALRVLLPPLE